MVDGTTWERVNACDLCGGTDARPVLCTTDLGERIAEGELRLVRCRACRLAYLDPRPTPESIGTVYPGDYRFFTDTTIKPLRRWQRAAARPDDARSLLDRLAARFGEEIAFHLIPKWNGPGKILDIGCGSGAFLDTMKQLGWETHGRDPSAQAAEVAARKGHIVRTGTAEDLDYDSESFDVVYLWHVLEHTHSPRHALGEIRRILRPGGQLVLSVPNYGGFQARLWGRFWSALDLPRHLFQFDRRTLRRYLDEAGFHDVAIWTRTGATSIPKTLRLLVNGLFGARLRREPGWTVALCEPLIVLLSLFRYFGAGNHLRAVCTRR